MFQRAGDLKCLSAASASQRVGGVPVGSRFGMCLADVQPGQDFPKGHKKHLCAAVNLSISVDMNPGSLLRS